MEEAFSPGYDPALELVTHSIKMQHLAERGKQERADLRLDLEDSNSRPRHPKHKKQDAIDLIVKGVEVGRYYVLLGAKVMSKCSPSCGWVPSTSALGHGENNHDS